MSEESKRNQKENRIVHKAAGGQIAAMSEEGVEEVDEPSAQAFILPSTSSSIR